MMFELPHFAMELLVVLPCVQVWHVQLACVCVCLFVRVCKSAHVRAPVRWTLPCVDVYLRLCAGVCLCACMCMCVCPACNGAVCGHPVSPHEVYEKHYVRNVWSV